MTLFLDSYVEEILAEAKGDFDRLKNVIKRIETEEGDDFAKDDIYAFAQTHGFVTTVAAQPVQAPVTHAATNIAVQDYHAPFHFVALNQKVALPPDPVSSALKTGVLHSMPLAEGLCGHVNVVWEFDGPMLIGNGDKDPSPLKIGETPVLPGATVRGLVRSTMEIAALGRLEQLDGYLTFGIRDFEHDLFKSEGRRMVNAGWLRPSTVPGAGPQDYEIAPCKHHLVKIRTIKPGMNSGAEHLAWLKRGLSERYKSVNQSNDNLLDFSKTTRFSIVDTLRNGETIVRPDPIGPIEGAFVFSDKSPSLTTVAAADLDKQDLVNDKGNQKKVEHVFEPPNGKPIQLSKDALKDFLRMNCTSTGRGFEKDWWEQAMREGGHEKGPLRAQSNWKQLQPSLAKARAIPVFMSAHPGRWISTLDLSAFSNAAAPTAQWIFCHRCIRSRTRRRPISCRR